MRRMTASVILWLALAGSAWSATITVNTVADLATARPGDGDIVTTLGYSTAGIGANSYRYDADSAATANGGTIIAGPGGVGRYIAINQTRFDVTQFGAIPNDGVDDVDEIQAAIDAALTDAFHLDNGTGGPIVVLPPGDFAISEQLLLDTTLGNKITIEGAGPNISRIVRHTSFTGTVMMTSNTDVIADPSTEDRILYGCTFRDFAIYCRSDGNGDVDNGILIRTIAHSRFERVWVSYPNKCGMIVDWGYSNTFDQVRVDNSDMHGFVIGLDASEIARQYVFSNCIAVGCGEIGYYLNGGISYAMVNCDAENCGKAGIYANRVHGLDIVGGYFETVSAVAGIDFTTAHGSAIQGGTWTVKANIVLNGTNGGINSTTYAVPTDVSNAFPTEGVRINGHTQNNIAGVSFIAFVGCDGVCVEGYSANSSGTLAPDFLFNASYTLATNIDIRNHGSVNRKLNAVSLYDTSRNYYTGKFANIVIQDVDFPIIDVPVSGLTMQEASSGGTYAASTFSYRGITLYRLGSTASDGQVTDNYGSTINMGQYPHLRGKYATVVIEWLPGFGYNDVYGSLYNGGAQAQFYTEYDNNAIMATTATEVATTGTISAGSPTLTVASAAGLAIGDFVQISEAGAGTPPASHFARITNISGTTVTLSDNAVAAVTTKTVRTSVPRVSYQTIQIPSNVESVKFGIRRYLGRAEDAIYVAQMKIIPFGVQWPYMGN